MAVFLQGCGTVLPGARRQVDVRKYCFSCDGSRVFYQEDRYDYKMLSEKSRDRFYVFMYDVRKRKHRKIARSALMEVSPSGPVVYLGKDWRREDSADLRVLDYERRVNQPIGVMGMLEEYPYISISEIDWISDRDIVAGVGLSGENPCGWMKKIEGGEEGRIIRKTMVVDGDEAMIVDDERELPGRKVCRTVSPDGRYELKEEPYERRFMFHTSLYLEDGESKKRTYITKDSHILSVMEGTGYMMQYIGFGVLHVLGIK